MAKHQAISPHSLKTRTVISGALVSGALLLGAPAGMASAITSNPAPSTPVGNAINHALATHPKAAQELGKIVSKLPPKTQKEIGALARKLGVNLRPPQMAK